MLCGKCNKPIYKGSQAIVTCKNITVTDNRGGFNLFGDFLKNYQIYHNDCLDSTDRNAIEKFPTDIFSFEDQVIKGLRELGIKDSVDKIKKFIWQNTKSNGTDRLKQEYTIIIKEYLLLSLDQ